MLGSGSGTDHVVDAHRAYVEDVLPEILESVQTTRDHQWLPLSLEHQIACDWDELREDYSTNHNPPELFIKDVRQFKNEKQYNTLVQEYIELTPDFYKRLRDTTIGFPCVLASRLSINQRQFRQCIENVEGETGEAFDGSLEFIIKWIQASPDSFKAATSENVLTLQDSSQTQSSAVADLDSDSMTSCDEEAELCLAKNNLLACKAKLEPISRFIVATLILMNRPQFGSFTEECLAGCLIRLDLPCTFLEEKHY